MAMSSLPGSIAVELAAGDGVRIATPGGGGYGASEAMGGSAWGCAVTRKSVDCRWVSRAGAMGLAVSGFTALPLQAQVQAPLLGANLLQERSQRAQPVESGGGMVAAQEAQAAAVGARILRAGGNAVDAAVATSFALAVTLPQAGNLGGGGFLLLWLPRRGPIRTCAAANRVPPLPQALPIGRGRRWP